MINKLIKIEESILNNQAYLMQYYPSTNIVLSQVSMLLDFGMSNDKIKDWLRLNKISINIIDEILQKRNNESFTN